MSKYTVNMQCRISYDYPFIKPQLNKLFKLQTNSGIFVQVYISTFIEA